MATTPELLDRMQKLRLRDTLPSLIQDTQQVLIDLNRDQLKHGLTNKGEKIQPKYSSITYAIDKERQNSLAGFLTPDLFVTGSFYNSFFFKVNGFNYTFGATDGKSDKISAKYADIYGITDLNKENYVQNTLSPKINSYITQTTGLDMR